MAIYYCEICKFFDNEPDRDVYHCSECGICRRGKINEYFHCKVCAACFPLESQASHAACSRQGILHADCSICGDDMFSSRLTSQIFECGHAMHTQCREQYLQSGATTCPVCRRSIIDGPHYRQAVEFFLAANPMPSEYKGWIAQIHCNDCQKQSKAPFHFSYHKCAECDSYNTDLISKHPPTPDNSSNCSSGSSVSSTIATTASSSFSTTSSESVSTSMSSPFSSIASSILNFFSGSSIGSSMDSEPEGDEESEDENMSQSQDGRSLSSSVVTSTSEVSSSASTSSSSASSTSSHHL